MRDLDSANLKRLKHIVSQDGFPTAEMVGLDGINAAWLLTVHAAGDADFQEEVLKLTEEHVRRGEVRSDQVAMLTDDLLDGRGKPQRYGTNFVLRDGELKPAPMEDEANVDKRRRAVGLGTLANYACVLLAMSARPNLRRRILRPLSEPSAGREPVSSSSSRCHLTRTRKSHLYVGTRLIL